MLSRCTSKYFQVISELKTRKLLYQSTSPTIPIKGAVYCGFDPTAHSLHLGNFISILNLARLAKLGFSPIAIVGGATVQLGDPSFKIEERSAPDLNLIAKHTSLIIQQLQFVYGNIQKLHNLPQLTVLNNSDFYKNENLIEFISKVGRKFRMNALLNKEHIRRRVDSEEGLSLTEFFYTILQSYDFAYLSEKYDCTLQIGGSDQWGNITNGCDFVRREYKKQVYGITTPLLVDKNGQKFGKSEGNALFLSQESEFTMKQYLLNLPDDAMEDYLKQLTFLPITEINEILSKKEPRIAQNHLISELMAMIYGKKKENKNQILYDLRKEKLLSMNEFDFETLIDVVDQEFIIRIPKDTQLIDILTKIRPSKSEIRRLIEQGGLTVNGERNSQIEMLCNKYMLVKLGKRDVRLIIFI